MQALVSELLDAVTSERGRAAAVATTVALLNGPPAEVIEEHLNATDILVIGSRGLGGVRRLLLGSVSGALVQTAPCPVIVVRAAGEQHAVVTKATEGVS